MVVKQVTVKMSQRNTGGQIIVAFESQGKNYKGSS